VRGNRVVISAMWPQTVRVELWTAFRLERVYEVPTLDATVVAAINEHVGIHMRIK